MKRQQGKKTAKPNRARRGAVDRKPAKRARPSLRALAPLLLNKTLLASAVAIGVASTYVSLRAVEEVLDVPLERVEIGGAIEYQPRADVHTIIEETAVNGFIQVDLKELYSSLKGLEWVRDVSIKRTLPNGLHIELIEEEPIAYWNDKSLITEYAEVITPKTMPQIAGLVRMSGGDHQEVLEIYKELTSLLPKEHGVIRQLSVDDRKVILIALAEGYELIVNKGQLHEQLARWQQIANGALANKMQQIETVDLRYSNGAAVGWKQTVAQNNKLLNGGHH